MIGTVEQSQFCQYYYRDLDEATLPDTRLALRLRRHWWVLKRYVWYINILGRRGFRSRILPSTRLGKSTFKRKVESARENDEVLNLQDGEWVEVRSAREIFATLDKKDKLRGLRFTPEMAKFCGKRFKVYKKLDKIILEATGELRKIKTPTVLLEGVFCDGTAHGGCDRSCFCFWREQWLKNPSSEIS
jgi:hypothetical protein